jgi:hypothetical protein
MASDDELEELHEKQEEEVLKREGVEEELMAEGRSYVGERLGDVQDEPEGEALDE